MAKGEAEIVEEVNKIQKIRNDVISEMEDKLNERYLYTIAYDNFNLSTPEKNNEVGLQLKNVYIVAKQIEDAKGKILRQFQIYNSKLNKIAETAKDGRLIYDDNERFDREITEEIIKLSNLLEQKNKESGTNMKIAGLDENEQLRVYMQLSGKTLVSLTERQREKLNGANELEKDSSKITKQSDNKPVPQEINNKEKKEVNLANQEKEEQIYMIANDMEMKPEDIWQITPIRDDLFYINNNLPVHSNAFAVVTRNGEVSIVSQKDGKFEKTLDKSTNESGRTNVITNDTNKLEEKNTYGAVYSNVDPNLRYVIHYDQYGAIHIDEERAITQNESGQIIAGYETWKPARELTTGNTNGDDVDRKGTSSVTKYTFNPTKNKSMNKEHAATVNNEGKSITPEDVVDDYEVRANSALEKVKAELKNRGLDLPSENEEELRKEFKEKGISLSDEDAKTFCDSYEIKLREEKEKEEEEKQERTLAGDALERRAQSLAKNKKV